MKKIMISVLFGALAFTSFMVAGLLDDLSVDMGITTQVNCKSKTTGQTRIGQYGTYKKGPHSAEEACRLFGADFVPDMSAQQIAGW